MVYGKVKVGVSWTSISLSFASTLIHNTYLSFQTELTKNTQLGTYKGGGRCDLSHIRYSINGTASRILSIIFPCILNKRKWCETVLDRSRIQLQYNFILWNIFHVEMCVCTASEARGAGVCGVVCKKGLVELREDGVLTVGVTYHSYPHEEC